MRLSLEDTTLAALIAAALGSVIPVLMTAINDTWIDDVIGFASIWGVVTACAFPVCWFVLAIAFQLLPPINSNALVWGALQATIFGAVAGLFLGLPLVIWLSWPLWWGAPYGAIGGLVSSLIARYRVAHA